MPRRTAGARYPHVTTAAKEHDHAFCPVVEAIIARNAEQGEPWGTRHEMPAVKTEDAAKRAKSGFYHARNCARLGRVLGERVSVQADYEKRGEVWVPWVRVWPRSLARLEIARRVEAGERLSYNVARSA